jgi:plastocyanin domain-containing protein
MVAIAGLLSIPASLGASPGVQNRSVRITEQGFVPATLTVRRGIRTRITFLRTTDNTCAKEVVFPDFGIKRELPLNQPVVITLTPSKKGEFRFTCGMNMMNGKLIVQ